QVPVMAAFAGYWSRFGAAETRKRHLRIGCASLTICLIAMLFAATPIADNIIGVMADKEKIKFETIGKIVIYGIPAMICYFFVERPIRFGLVVAALWLATFYSEYRLGHNSDIHPRYRPFHDRSFFGRLKIERWIRWVEIPPYLFPDVVL